MAHLRKGQARPCRQACHPAPARQVPPQRPLLPQARAHAPWQSGPKQTQRPRPKRAAPLNQQHRCPQAARHRPPSRRHLHPWCRLRHALLHRQQRATRPTHTRHRPSPPRLTHPWSPHPQRLRWRQRLWQHHPPNHLRLPRPNSHPVLQRHLPNPHTLRPPDPVQHLGPNRARRSTRKTKNCRNWPNACWGRWPRSTKNNARKRPSSPTKQPPNPPRAHAPKRRQTQRNECNGPEDSKVRSSPHACQELIKYPFWPPSHG
jgi:hypothetical protein